MDRSRLDQVLEVGVHFKRPREGEPDDGRLAPKGVYRETNFGRVHDLAIAVLLKMEVRRIRQALNEAAAGPQYRTLADDMERNRAYRALDDEERDLDQLITDLSPIFDHELSALHKRIENARLGIEEQVPSMEAPAPAPDPDPNRPVYRSLWNQNP